MQFADTVRRLMEFAESAKLATEKRGDMELQMVRSVETSKDALRWLTDLSRRVDLPEKKAQGLKSPLAR